MGVPKQLLPFGDTTLIGHAIRQALASGCSSVVVVLGANADSICNTLLDQPVSVVENPDWREGMGASIRVGLRELLRLSPELDGVLLMLVDQPFVKQNDLRELVVGFERSRGCIVASRYERDEVEIVGVPALFGRSLFPELLALRGGEGAKKIILANYPQTCLFSCPAGIFDLDTREDYERALVRLNLMQI
jgi:molybdenum cofactor cytidylyltransferase